MITFLASDRLDRLQRIAGVDRPDEGVGRDDFDDVRYRRDIQLGGQTRGEVLSVRGRWGQDGVVAVRQRQHGRFDRLGQHLAQTRALGQQHLAHAGDLGGAVGGGLGALAQDQDVHVGRQAQSGGHGLVGGVANGRTVVIGDDEDSHITALPRT